MSPEYALEGLFSIKSDVFSLGVVILEIITGRRNTGFYQSKEASNLLGYVSYYSEAKNTSSSLFQSVGLIFIILNDHHITGMEFLERRTGTTFAGSFIARIMQPERGNEVHKRWTVMRARRSR